MRRFQNIKGFAVAAAAFASLATTGCMSDMSEMMGGALPGPTAPAPSPTPTPAPAPAPAPAPKAPMLLVANYVGNSVTGYADPGTLNGNVTPTMNLAGGQTGLGSPSNVRLDASGELITANTAGKSLTIHTAGEAANGNIRPDRNIAGAATALAYPLGIARDAETDAFFVGDNGTIPGSILMFTNISAAGTLGNLAPLHKITSGDIGAPTSIALSDEDDLYVTNVDKRTIAVFADATNINGSRAADRVISSAAFVGPGNYLEDVVIDQNDTMFVLLSSGRVAIFAEARSLNGNRMPDAILTITGANTVQGIAVDTNGTGYVADYATNSIYVFDDFATRNGTFAPDRTISGARTQLSGPFHIYIAE